MMREGVLPPDSILDNLEPCRHRLVVRDNPHLIRCLACGAFRWEAEPTPPRKPDWRGR